MSQEYQANLIKMQHQIRNNAQEYSDFVSDLQKWTKNISEKDKKLQEAPQTKVCMTCVDYTMITNIQ